MTSIEEIEFVQSQADCLYSKLEVEAVMDKMAEQITAKLADKNPLMLCLMNGGVVLAGGLLSRMHFPLTFDSINASRYLGKTEGGSVQWIQKPLTPVKDREVLLVDDILDRGFTLQTIHQYCQEQGATSINIATLVDKKIETIEKPIKADFIGLTLPNRYLFGYGMDYKGYLRNAPGIFACKEEV